MEKEQIDDAELSIFGLRRANSLSCRSSCTCSSPRKARERVPQFRHRGVVVSTFTTRWRRVLFCRLCSAVSLCLGLSPPCGHIVLSPRLDCPPATGSFAATKREVDVWSGRGGYRGQDGRQQVDGLDETTTFNVKNSLRNKSISRALIRYTTLKSYPLTSEASANFSAITYRQVFIPLTPLLQESTNINKSINLYQLYRKNIFCLSHTITHIWHLHLHR